MRVSLLARFHLGCAGCGDADLLLACVTGHCGFVVGQAATPEYSQSVVLGNES